MTNKLSLVVTSACFGASITCLVITPIWEMVMWSGINLACLFYHYRLVTDV